jgi:hypothetical protein
MLKHDEWAAAMSSSGVVTELDPSLRAFQFTSNVPMPEEEKAKAKDPKKEKKG